MAQTSTSQPTRTLYLLHGEDPFRTRLRLAELVRSLISGADGAPSGDGSSLDPALGPTLGLTRFDASDKTFDVAAVVMAGRSQGLFDAPDERRVVVVDHAEALHETEFLADVPPEAGLVLVAHERIAASRARRAPARGRAAAPSAAAPSLPDAVLAAGGTVERIERLGPEALPAWIRARAALRGATLTPEAVDALAALGPDTARHEQELGKLAAYAAGAPITLADVERLVSGAIEADVFRLTSAVVARDARAAVVTLDRLLTDGQAVLQVLAMLLWQFRVLLFAAQLNRALPPGAPKPDPVAMAKAIRSSSPGAILRWQTAARGVKVADVTRAYEALYATDVAIKSGRVDSDAAALTLCVLDLCGVRAARMTELLELPVARR